MKKKTVMLQKLHLGKSVLVHLNPGDQDIVKGGDTISRGDPNNCTRFTCPVYVVTTPEYTCAVSQNCHSTPADPCLATQTPTQTGC